MGRGKVGRGEMGINPQFQGVVSGHLPSFTGNSIGLMTYLAPSMVFFLN